MAARRGAHALARAASFFYDVCELYEDEDLDSNDHVAVIQRAFSSSNCDDFAWTLHRITGWPGRRATWVIPNWGFGHHTFLEAPNGRFLDVCGWSTANALQRRYCPRKKMRVQPWAPEPQVGFDPHDRHSGAEPSLIAGILAFLPYPPYSQDWFRKVTEDPATILEAMISEQAPAFLAMPTTART